MMQQNTDMMKIEQQNEGENGMLTVVIAEDEQKVGQLINKLILWDELDLHLVSIVDNGKDAFDFVCSEKPDIVITDIRMPKMDGLELIRRTRELNINTKFIVISGYRFFEYARSALKYGVEDYLLKPIKQEELNQILKKISTDKKNDINQQKDQIILKRELHTSKNALMRELIEKLISRSEDCRSMAMVNQTYSLHFEEKAFRAITFKLDYKDWADRNSRQDHLVLDKLTTLIHEHLKSKVIELIAAIKDEQYICCILNYDKAQSPQLFQDFSSLFSSVQDYIYAFEDYEITMGVGEEGSHFNELYTTIHSAMEALRYRLVVGIRRRINFSDYHFKPTPAGGTVVQRYKIRLSNAIESFDLDKLKDIIDQMFAEYLSDEEYNPEAYYDLALQLAITFFDLIPQDSGQTQVQAKNEVIEMIPNLTTVPSLLEHLKFKLCGVLQRYQEYRNTQDYKPVRDAKQYIDEHYSEKIVLDDIAKIIGLNPVYLSVIFKKEIGENFSDYLCHVRMEVAKELLRGTNETVASIAERVGYKDAKYFSQTFTKIVGIKPAQFRKLYS